VVFEKCEVQISAAKEAVEVTIITQAGHFAF
jgi:hypothetical protein